MWAVKLLQQSPLCGSGWYRSTKYKGIGIHLHFIPCWWLQGHVGQVVKGCHWLSSACAKCSSSCRQCMNSQFRPRLDTSTSLGAPLAGSSTEYPVQVRSDCSSMFAGQRSLEYLINRCASLRPSLPVAIGSALQVIVMLCYHCSSFGRQAFFVADLMAWNSLPSNLHDTSLSEDTFRRSLKTYFFALH